MTVPGRGGEGWVDDAVLGRFDVEEERGVGVEAHAEDVEEGAWWRRTRKRSRRRRVCDRKIKGYGLGAQAYLKIRILAMGMITSSMSVATYKLSTPITTVVMLVSTD
jgi:hypothetical protein